MGDCKLGTLGNMGGADLGTKLGILRHLMWRSFVVDFQVDRAQLRLGRGYLR